MAQNYNKISQDLTVNSIVVSNLTASAVVTCDSGKKLTSTVLSGNSTDYFSGAGTFVTAPSGPTGYTYTNGTFSTTDATQHNDVIVSGTSSNTLYNVKVIVMAKCSTNVAAQCGTNIIYATVMNVGGTPSIIGQSNIPQNIPSSTAALTSTIIGINSTDIRIQSIGLAATTVSWSWYCEYQLL